MLNLSIDDFNLDASFDRIAQLLFNNYVLQIGQVCYQFTEIEFYYNKYDATNPLDNFAHHHGDEYPNGTWRLHGAGLDIVLKKSADYYGGILLRGLQQLDNHQEPLSNSSIDGPWNCATTCIKNRAVEDEQSSFFLKRRRSQAQRNFKKSPRVGLFLKNPEDLKYICKPWRYNATPFSTQKYRHLLFLQLWFDKDPEYDQIVPNPKTQERYIQFFQEGKNIPIEDLIGLKNTVANSCKLFGCYIHKYS